MPIGNEGPGVRNSRWRPVYSGKDKVEGSVNFYDVRGVLVRRCEPVRRGIALEYWDGETWLPYADVDAVLAA